MGKGTSGAIVGGLAGLVLGVATATNPATAGLYVGLTTLTGAVVGEAAVSKYAPKYQ